MSTPLVTIRCLVYNHEPYLRQCLDGFVMQKTDFPFEAIVHDDASTDRSAEIIREYAEKYPDIIKPIFEAENQYSKRDGSIRRILNMHTRGEYVAMCEGDDFWIDPLKLQKQVDFLESHPDYGLVYTDVNFYFQKKNKVNSKCISSGYLKRSYTFLDHLENGGYIAPCTWLYRKEFLPHSSTVYVDGTFPLALDIWAKSKIFFFNEVTAVYRCLTESASHSIYIKKRFLFAKGLFTIQKEYINKYTYLVPENTKRRIYLNNYCKIFPSAIVVNDKEFLREALVYFKSGIKLPHKVKIISRLYVISPKIITLILKVLYKIKGIK